MEFDTITLELNAPIARLSFNRPESLNAISRAMMADVRTALDTCRDDPDIAAVIVCGEGRAFSAGMDLKDDAAGDTSGAGGWRQVLSENLDFVTWFWDFSKPTIAAVHGYCLAAGCDVALACDITIAEEGTYFGKPELQFGSVITAMVMPYLTAPKVAKELLLTGEDRLSAERAHALGLVNRVVPKGEAISTANELARRIAVMDADAVRLTKLSINRALDAMGLRAALQANLDLSVEIEALETPSRQNFKAISRDRGLQAALEWRARRLRDRDT